MAGTVMTSRSTDERDGTGVYLEKIGKTPLLNAVQEVELSKAIEAGLYAEHLLGETPVRPDLVPAQLEILVRRGAAAKELFLKANLRLVVSIARRYTRSGMPMDDIIQEGNAGLIRAIEKFDYHRGYKFSTYATWWIRQAISRAIAQQERTVRLPVHLVEDINRLRRMEREYVAITREAPADEDMAVAMGVTVERIRLLRDVSRDTISLDTPIGDDGDTKLGDLMADTDTISPDEFVLNLKERERAESLLKELAEEDSRLAKLMRARCGFDDGHVKTLKEVGQQLGLSRERIRQLELIAIGKLRELATYQGLRAA